MQPPALSPEDMWLAWLLMKEGKKRGRKEEGLPLREEPHTDLSLFVFLHVNMQRRISPSFSWFSYAALLPAAASDAAPLKLPAALPAHFLPALRRAVLKAATRCGWRLLAAAAATSAAARCAAFIALRRKGEGRKDRRPPSHLPIPALPAYHLLWSPSSSPLTGQAVPLGRKERRNSRSVLEKGNTEKGGLL